MAHVYASLDEAKRYAADEGIAWGPGSTNDALALSILVSVSRRIDGWCRRSAFGSGFGPRLGTNRYDAEGGTALPFRDDCISLTTVTLRASTASATTSTIAADTDYYLVNQQGQYEPGPYRRLILHGQGTATLPSGLRVVESAGSWGYQDVTETLTPTTSEALDDSETVIDVSALGELSPGMTILIGTEQMYVRAVTDSTTDSITVDRGVNGTTAASHLTAAAIVRQVYPGEVTECALRLWGRRWAARSAGADGADGGGQVGISTPRESEDTILRRTIGHLRLIDARSISFGRRADAE